MLAKERGGVSREAACIPCIDMSLFSACGVCPPPYSMDRPLTKRCSNLSTCVLGKLSQELHKLQTFPRTNVGAGTPGRKRSAPAGDGYASYGDTFDSI